MATIFRKEYESSRTTGTGYPQTLRTWVSAGSVLTLLLSPIARPPIQTSTDLPRTTVYPNAARTWTQNLQQTTLFVAPSTRPVGSTDTSLAPSRASYPHDLRSTIVAGLLESTLTPLTVQRFPVITETPIGPAYPHALRTWTQGPIPPTAATKPGGQGCFPVPATASYPNDLRTTITTRFLGSSQTYELRLPNVAPAWRAPYPHDLRTTTVNLLDSTLAPLGSLPAGGRVFDTPTGPVYPLANRTHVVYFVLDDNTPPQPSDITTQLPRTALYPLDLRTHVSGSIRLISTIKPFHQTEWPTPVGAAYPAHLRTATVDLQQSTLFTGPQTPVGGSTSYTTPPAPYPPDRRTELVNLQQTTLFTGPQTPHTQTDWPTPRGAGYPIDLRTSFSGRALVLKDTGVRALGEGFQNYDWPTPIGSPYPGSLRTTTVNLLQSTLRPLFRAEWAATVNKYVGPEAEST